MKLSRLFFALFCFVIFNANVHAAPLKVVASFSILENMVAEVGQNEVLVQSIIPKDTEAHGFSPRPSDALLLKNADIFFINGLFFEGWLPRLVKSSGFAGKTITLTNGIKTLSLKSKDNHGHSHGSKEQNMDPHAWQDLSNAQIYVDNIEKALSAAKPESAAFFAANAKRYKKELADLETHLQQQFAKLPANTKKVISMHDAFAYFGRAYGVTFHPISGINNDAEPSAKALSNLIKTIRAENIKVAFLEQNANPRLLKSLQQEAQISIGKELYADALSKEDAAQTYLKMMRYNGEAILEALAK